MALITRASIPEEFLDLTSAKLLRQPEPQYLHAQLAKMALSASFPSLSAIGLPGRTAGEGGAPYTTAADDAFVMSDPIFGEAIKAVVEMGNRPGHTIRMNRPKFAGSGYTLANRVVPANTSIGTTPIDLSSEQVAVTCMRYAGPFDGTAVAPYGLDKFDAGFSIHKMAGIVGRHMQRDFDKWLDTSVVTLYDSVTTAVFPAGFAANTDFLVAGDGPLDWETLTRVEETLKEANVQPFANGRWVCVINPRQEQQLKNDPSYVRQTKYFKEVSQVFNSYIGTCGNLDVFTSNTLSTTASTVTVYNGQAFGPEMVGIGAANMPFVAYSTDDNYGETPKVIWLWYAGFAVLDSRFGVSIRTS
jgi:N4-gp56 family major capsid protein